MACIEPREASSVRCFNKHERFPLSHLYFAHVSRDCSASHSSPSIDNRPNAVKKNSFTLHLLFTTTYTILCNTTKHPIFSPLPPLPLPSFTVVCLLLASSLLPSRAYLPSLRTSSINHLDFWGPITPTASLIYHNFTFKAG